MPLPLLDSPRQCTVVAAGRSHDRERGNAYQSHQGMIQPDQPDAAVAIAGVNEENPPCQSWVRRVRNRFTGSE